MPHIGNMKEVLTSPAYAGGIAAGHQTEPARALEIPERVGALSYANDEMAAVVSELSTRLQDAGVLSPPPVGEDSAKLAHQNTTPLGAAIHAETTRTLVCVRHLRELMSRLEA